MGRHEPFFASEKTAAALLDMKPAEFRNLVEAGSLPPPKLIGDLKRWDTGELKRIASGEKIEDDFET